MSLPCPFTLTPVLLKHYTTASFTTEYCDEHLTDETPDAERVDPQMAAIRGMIA